MFRADLCIVNVQLSSSTRHRHQFRLSSPVCEWVCVSVSVSVCVSARGPVRWGEVAQSVSGPVTVTHPLTVCRNRFPWKRRKHFWLFPQSHSTQHVCLPVGCGGGGSRRAGALRGGRAYRESLEKALCVWKPWFWITSKEWLDGGNPHPHAFSTPAKIFRMPEKPC